MAPALEFEVLARCSTTRARVSRMRLPHSTTRLPTFMSVGTQASLKGTTYNQVLGLGDPSHGNDITLVLNNTYHLSLRPGTDTLDFAGGAHEFQGWPRNLLTDSGGSTNESQSKK